MPAHSARAARGSWLDAVCGLLFLIGWILPLSYQVFTSVPPKGFPLTWWHVCQVSCLFPRRVAQWPTHYFQVMLPNDDRWLTLPEEAYSTMRPFGHRTRLQYFLDRAQNVRARDALAVWVRTRYLALHPDGPKPRAVRFVYGFWRPSGGVPAGHWRTPPLESFPSRDIVVFYTRPFDEGDMPAPASQ